MIEKINTLLEQLDEVCNEFDCIAETESNWHTACRISCYREHVERGFQGLREMREYITTHLTECQLEQLQAGYNTVKPAVTEANPDDYAATEDALEVAVNAEIKNVAHEADHIADTGNKEKQPMTDKLIISTKENADGRITAYYLNGKKTRKAEIEYCYANNPAYDGIIQTDYYTAKCQFPNLYYGHGCRYFIMTLNEETLMSKAAADLLGYQIGRPFARGIYRVIKLDQTIPDDDSSNDEEPDLIVETKRTKRDSINLKLNGSRISLRNLEDCLSNAPTDFFSVINQYGKEYSCYPAHNYGYFGESPEGYTIHFNTLGELIEHYAVDNIIHTAEPAKNPA